MANPKYPRNPGRILTTAFKMGIAITLALAKDRATGPARPLYFGQGKRIMGMAKVWKRTKDAYRFTVENLRPDASILLKAEHAIRRSFSRILLKTAVRYGNNETKRVKQEEGRKGYLNILWDYAGSRIRDIVKPRYIFPKPALIDRAGSSKVYGYRGSSRKPFYQVRHNHLPELDFGDMVRSPLMELARQCLRFGVDIRDAKKYIDTLLFRFLPFMDYVYTERRSGRANYVRDGLKELRIVVNQIEEEHGTRNGVRQSITAEVEESIIFEEIAEKESISLETSAGDEPLNRDSEYLIESAIDAALKQGTVSNDLLNDVKDLLNAKILTMEDSTELVKQVQEERRRIGVKFHDFIAKNFPAPFSLNGILFHGTEMAYDGSGLMLFSEVPIDNGRGRIDLLLAHAKELSRVDESTAPIRCEPILIADLKTKSAFNFDIYGVESRSSTSKNIVSEFVLERRALTDEEWDSTISNVPDEYMMSQLDAYEIAVTTAYRNMIRDDPDAVDNLTKAVIVVDSFQDWKSISEALLPLVLEAYRGCMNESLCKGDIILPSKEDSSLRIAMKLLSVAKQLTEPSPLDPPLSLEPFTMRVPDDKDFILYLTVPGRGAPAQSAAAIAERWHGLEYLQGLAGRKHRNILWLDLAGEYQDPILRKKQFRLVYHTAKMKRFFTRRVKMLNLSEAVNPCLLGQSNLTMLREHVQAYIQDRHNPIIVISGWEYLRRCTPYSRSDHLDKLVSVIFHALPKRCTVLWFARPVPIAQNSITYSTRCLAPFYQGTIWQNLVDTIIWNVPMPPNRSGAQYPTNDYERVIFIETPEKKLDKKIVEVPPLTDWGKDFGSGGRERIVYHRGAGQGNIQKNGYLKTQLDKTLDLIPHLRPSTHYNPHPRSNELIHFASLSSGNYQEQDTSFMLSFKPSQIYVAQSADEPPFNFKIDGRMKALLPISSINATREYRKMQLGVSPRKRTTRPPNEQYLKPRNIEDSWIVRTEIQHLNDTLRFLKRDGAAHLTPLLGKLETIITVEMKKNPIILMNILRLVRQTLESHSLSKEVWDRLVPSRTKNPRGFTLPQKEHLASLQQRHPDILLITGNHLFLLLLASLGPFATISYSDVLWSLWDYVRPWHLIGLGFKVKYPKLHSRGRSVLDRDKLIQQLKRRCIRHNKLLDGQNVLTRVRFGQLIMLPSSGATDSLNFWLLFQRKPNSFDMNAALLNPRGLNPSSSPLETLLEMVSEQTYWSESDLSRLSWYAEKQGTEKRLPIMLAVHRGVQTLFFSDPQARVWIPIGSIDYSTRRFEDVTLIRTVSLSEDPHLQSVSFDVALRPLHNVNDMAERALLILNKGLEGCIHVTCKVALEQAKRMYSVSFFHQTSGNTIGNLLINRTVDLLEILRRPDTVCEPVIINGERLIWNRFNDITLDADVALLRPWVNKSQPFSGLALQLPPTARDLLEAQKESDLTLEVFHDPWTCPLRHISLEDIKQYQHRVKTIDPNFWFRTMRPWAEPERISNEPGIHHGSCWQVHPHSRHTLPPELEEVMDVHFTDAQLCAFLQPQELIYRSKEQQKWTTHTFGVSVNAGCRNELRESWHLRRLFAEIQRTTMDPNLPGTYLQNPDRWKPFITIEPGHIVFQLRERNSSRIMERQVMERNVALREASDVKDFLTAKMDAFLKDCGITTDRRLKAAIENEIADAIELGGIEEGKARAELDDVIISRDGVGGRLLYVILTANDQMHRIPVTKHLHTIKEVGRIPKEKFVEQVESILNEFNLSEEDLKRAVKECLRFMRMEGLIK